MVSRRFLVVAFASMFIPASFADQYAYVTVQQATAAMKVIGEGHVVQSFCAPCGEKTSRAIKADKLEVGRIWEGKSAKPYQSGRESYWELSINGKAMDLAYVYVRKQGKWENLAMVLGLDVSDVPRFLDTAQVGASNG